MRTRRWLATGLTLTVGVLALAATQPATPALAQTGATVASNLAVDSLTSTWEANSEVGSTGSPQPQPTTTADCGVWTGGDGTQVTQLNDGDYLWSFGDTYLGPAVTRQDFFNNSFIRNSMVVQSGSAFTTITGGTGCPDTTTGAVTPFSPAGSSTTGYVDWPASSITYGSDVVKFYYAADGLEPVEPEVAELPQSELESGDTITPVVTTQLDSCGSYNVMWGQATLTAVTDGTTYTYIYGEGYNTSGAGSGLYLARTTGDPSAQSDWTYYTGDGDFSGQVPSGDSCSTVALAAAGDISVATELTVTELNGAFWLVEDDPVDGTYPGWAVAHEALDPWSFTNSASDAVSLFEPAVTTFSGINDDFPGVTAYAVRLLSAVTASTSGDVVVSYNVNSSAVDTGCVSLLNYDANAYVPRFIDVPTADFSTSGLSDSVRRSSAGTVTAAAPRPVVRTVSPTAARTLANPEPSFPAAVRRLGALRLRLARQAATSAGAMAAPEQASSSWTYNPEAVPTGTTWTTAACSAIPPPVEDTSVTANTDGSAELSWPYEGADIWYWVDWSDQTTSPDTWTEEEFWTQGPNADGWEPGAGLLPASTTSTMENHFIPASGSNGDDYSFLLEAFDAGDSLLTSTSGNATTPVALGVATPAGLTATVDSGGGGVTLTWTAIGAWQGETVWYYVDYKPVSGSSWTEIGPFGSNTADVAPLSDSQEYEFEVAAINNIGTGSFSSPVTATP
ncbi:MAG: fibronectin type III domain-containing protein [Streptosporangiaceae bacterium]|jgi:hypothetical protein